MANMIVPKSQQAEFIRAESELVIEQARKDKAEKYAKLGEPIELKGIAIDLHIRGDYAWTAENSHVARKVDLENGKTAKLYKGHSGPVTCLAFCDLKPGSGDGGILLTGSWDKTIKAWNAETGELISTTPAQEDFVKSLHVVPSKNLLVSGGSDKAVRFWDLSTVSSSAPLKAAGSLSSHRRPVEALASYVAANGDLSLFTSDSAGLINAWSLRYEGDIWRATVLPDGEMRHHRTGVTEMFYGEGHLWSSSSDETVQVVPYPLPPPTAKKPKPIPPITLPTLSKALLPLPLVPSLAANADAFPYLLAASGDIIRVYDISELDSPELLREVTGHWHDVTRLRVWLRSDKENKAAKSVWIVSAGLDRTLRRWKLSGMPLISTPDIVVPETQSTKTMPPPAPAAKADNELTEEEERELAELMGDDD
ncbi:WD40 repeat-like protein [Peniophora sp. CONT]|nr:WD40 repeat-like protein [Peniophora sp. CONT]